MSVGAPAVGALQQQQQQQQASADGPVLELPLYIKEAVAVVKR